MKTVTFRIEPFAESLNRFKETFKAVQSGRHIEPQICLPGLRLNLHTALKF